MKMDESSNKDVEALAWEGDGGSTDVLLWARDQDGMSDMGLDGLDSSPVDMDGPSIERDISSGVHDDVEDVSSSGRGEGTLPVRSERRQTQYETEENNDPSGTAGNHRSVDIGGAEDGGEMVKIDRVIQRFKEQTRLTLKERSQGQYILEIKKLDRHAHLGRYSKRQLEGAKGKEIIKEFIATVPIRSRKTCLAYLRSMWIYGLDASWPIDTKRDIGRLPPTRRGQTPPDAIVKEWHTKLKNETDPYNRLLWLFFAQTGLRPSHLYNLKWRNIQLNDEGWPTAIIADGVEEGFKTFASVAVRIPEDLAGAILAWMEQVPERQPEWPLLPWRDRSGRVDPTKALDKCLLLTAWRRIERKWGLPHLRRKALRHWVSSKCRQLSEPARCYLQGHEVDRSNMGSWYDNPQIEDVLAEQGQVIPHGPLGLLEPPEVEIVGDLPEEAIGLLRQYLAGNIGTLEFANRVESLRCRVDRAELV